MQEGELWGEDNLSLDTSTYMCDYDIMIPRKRYSSAP